MSEQELKQELLEILDESVLAYCAREDNDDFYKGWILGQIDFCFVAGVISGSEKAVYRSMVGCEY